MAGAESNILLFQMTANYKYIVELELWKSRLLDERAPSALTLIPHEHHKLLINILTVPDESVLYIRLLPREFARALAESCSLDWCTCVGIFSTLRHKTNVLE